jgi:SET domain-containing protein
MLTIKTILLPSPIHGLGLFADEDIPAETVIYKIDDLLTVRHAVDFIEGWGRPEHVVEYFKKYAWKRDGYYYLSLDNDRFMNHSDTPNTYETQFLTIALVDIKKGEEITCNYDYLYLGLKPEFK